MGHADRADHAEQPDARAASRAIVRSWRELTGGSSVDDADRPTLLAVSGGADSSALALALGRTRGVRSIGHVVHDMRPRQDAEADRRLVEALGRVLDLPVRVAYADAGNSEAAARTARYGALARLARNAECRYVAVAHQADDVLETMLANLIRGAGPRGLRGPAPRRAIGDGVTLVRPMLGVGRAEAEAICRHACWTWAYDATNDDPTRLRAALRAEVTPVLERLRPGASRRAARAARAIREAARVVRDAVNEAWPRVAMRTPSGLELAQPPMVDLPPAVREGLLRRAIDEVAGRGHDRLSAATARSLSAWLVDGRGVRTVAGLRLEHRGGTIAITPAPREDA
ncbi:MAG: tRNA lysidine(34) synthetase TilS [Planctomycetota bacterium]